MLENLNVVNLVLSLALFALMIAAIVFALRPLFRRRNRKD